MELNKFQLEFIKSLPDNSKLFIEIECPKCLGKKNIIQNI